MEGYINLYDYYERDGWGFCILACMKRDDSSFYTGSLFYLDQGTQSFSVEHFSDRPSEEEVLAMAEDFIRRRVSPSYMRSGPRHPGHVSSK